MVWSSRLVQGVRKESAEMVPLLFDLHTQQVVTDEEIVDRVFRRSQVEGAEHNARPEDIIAATIDEMNGELVYVITEEVKRRREAEQKHYDSDRLRNVQQTKELYRARIQNTERRIEEIEKDIQWLRSGSDDEKNARKRLSANRSLITRYQNECKERLALFAQDRELVMDKKLVALNLITIV
jgi:hypothetical protein